MTQAKGRTTARRPSDTEKLAVAKAEAYDIIAQLEGLQQQFQGPVNELQQRLQAKNAEIAELTEKVHGS